MKGGQKRTRIEKKKIPDKKSGIKFRHEKAGWGKVFLRQFRS